MPSVFDNYIKEVSESVDSTLSRIDRDRKVVITTSKSPAEEIKFDLQKIIVDIFGNETVTLAIKLETPPPQTQADYAVATFALAKTLRKNPQEVAQVIADHIKTRKVKNIKDVEVAGPYINIMVDRHRLYNSMLHYVSSIGRKYGRSNVNTGKVAFIDFSSPNIAKPLGVGHLRSTIIGHALANIYEWTGFGVIRANHLGDWGTQFGELIYAYKTWGDDRIIGKNPVLELKNLYVKFHEQVKANPLIKKEARRLFNELEKGNDQLLALWKKFRDWSIDDFKKTYQKIGVRFDTYIGESYFAKQADEVIKDCLNKNVCKQDKQSAVVIVESLGDLPSFLLRKQDSSSLYIARDLAALKYRVSVFNPDVILYVVGSEQDLNFKQLFSLAKEVGYLPDTVRVEHIAFGMVLSEGQKMSTRKGTLVELETVMAKAIEKARGVLEKNDPSLNKQEMDDVAETIGVGAVLYNDLRQSRIKNISFDWDRMLKFEAGSSTYLQYTHVRISSILAKAAKERQCDESLSYQFEHDKEFELAKKILLFPQVINDSQENNAPHLICTYLEELAQHLNSFYAEVPVIRTKEDSLFSSRITLIKTVATVMENGLSLLGIKIPPKM